jgi:hypothetical protein
MNKKKIFISLLLLVFVLLICVSFFFIRDSFSYKFFIKSRKDYSEEYRERYQVDENNIIWGYVVRDIILTPEEEEEEGEEIEERFKKHCPDWSECSIGEIANYLGKRKWLDASFEISQNNDLENALLDLYSKWKKNQLQEDGTLDVGETSDYISTMNSHGLLSENERMVLLEGIYKWVLSQDIPLENFTDIKNSIQVNLLSLRFGLNIRNIDQLIKDLDTHSFIHSDSDREKVENFMCSYASHYNVQDLEGDKTSHGLRALWFYIPQKDFCKIPRNQEDEQIIKQITSGNYLRTSILYGDKYLNYTDELMKYIIINSDRIFVD